MLLPAISIREDICSTMRWIFLIADSGGKALITTWRLGKSSRGDTSSLLRRMRDDIQGSVSRF